MLTLAAAGGGFLLAVLWFDRMFDVQVLRHRGAADLPESVLASIAGYYRRVTTDAAPMGYAVGVVMVVTVAAVIGQLAAGIVPFWLGLASLAACAVPIALGLVRVLPGAARLGGRRDPLAQQSRLARAICRDHLFCFAALVVFLALQLAVLPRLV